MRPSLLSLVSTSTSSTDALLLPARRLKRDFPQHFHEGIRTHLVASGIAGFCCSAASNPIDVIKVRIMSDRTGQYRGSLHCAALLLKNEGPSASLSSSSLSFFCASSST